MINLGKQAGGLKMKIQIKARTKDRHEKQTIINMWMSFRYINTEFIRFH